jgi:hypothetical protein
LKDDCADKTRSVTRRPANRSRRSAPEREEPDLLPNQSPWFPTRDNPLYPGPLFFKESYMEPDQPGPTKDIQKWADVAMWQARKHDDPQHPKVTITMLYGDPLGVMAMVNGMYTGKVYRTRPR